MTKTEESKYWHKTERHQFQDELRHLQTRRGQFDAAMLHLDHPIPGTDLYLDVISDAGADAKIGYVSGSAGVQINGRNCAVDPEAEDEGVWYQTVGEGGAEGEMIKLEDVTSDVKTVWFSFPSGALEGAKSVKITVKSRCGNPEAGVQAKSITAKVG